MKQEFRAPRPAPHAPLLLALLLVSAAPALGETVNRIVAVVNDEVITTADVTAQVSSLLQNVNIAPKSQEEAVQMHAAMLGQLIEQRLILQEAKRMEVAVSPADVLEKLEQVRERYPSEAAFQEFLRAAALSEEVLKERLREQLMVQRAVDAKVRAKIVVTPQEITDAVGRQPNAAASGERVRASHILIRVTEERPEPQARQRAQEAHKQLLQGADFADTARRYSDAPDAADGGSLGWVDRGQLMPEIEEALFPLAIGTFSIPARSKAGFHIVKAEERATAKGDAALSVHDAAFQQLYEAKFLEHLTRWMNALKRDAYIEILGDK